MVGVALLLLLVVAPWLKRYIFRISEADCSMISATAREGVSPAFMRRARNSRSVRRPPSEAMQVSSSSRSLRRCEGGRALLLLSESESASESRWEITKRLATSGEQSPRESWRKTRSGRALPRDLEKETSVVRKMTWAMLAVVMRAALVVFASVRVQADRREHRGGGFIPFG